MTGSAAACDGRRRSVVTRLRPKSIHRVNISVELPQRASFCGKFYEYIVYDITAGNRTSSAIEHFTPSVQETTENVPVLG